MDRVAISLIVIMLAAGSGSAGFAEERFSWSLYGTVGFGKVDNEQLLNTTKVPYSNYTDKLSFDPLTKFGIMTSYRFTDKFRFYVTGTSRESRRF